MNKEELANTFRGIVHGGGIAMAAIAPDVQWAVVFIGIALSAQIFELPHAVKNAVEEADT